MDPPTERETIEVLLGVKDRYESFHHVEYTPDAIEAAVYQSSRYITDRFLPDKAIDLVDEAGARAKLREAGYSEEFGEINKSIRVAVEQMENAVSEKNFEKAQFYREQEVQARENLQFVREKFDVKSSTRRVVVGKAEIDEVVSKWTGVPLTSINQDEGDKLLRMEDELHKRVISQDKAISALSRAIRRSRAGLKNPNRPVGSFVFLGPTGVGKTELARALANFLFGSDHALIRFDMSEYMEKHSVSKLIGSPPGYVGHEEGGQLTEKVKRNPVLGRAARRNREGAPGSLQHPAAGLRGRPPHGRPRQPGELQEHDHHHDVEHRRPLHPEEGVDGVPGVRRRRHQPERQRHGARRGPQDLQPRVHQPHRRDHRVRGAVRRRPADDHAAAREAAE